MAPSIGSMTGTARFPSFPPLDAPARLTLPDSRRSTLGGTRREGITAWRIRTRLDDPSRPVPSCRFPRSRLVVPARCPSGCTATETRETSLGDRRGCHVLEVPSAETKPSRGGCASSTGPIIRTERHPASQTASSAAPFVSLRIRIRIRSDAEPRTKAGKDDGDHEHSHGRRV